MNSYRLAIILVFVFGLSFAQNTDKKDTSSVAKDACNCISKIQLDIQKIKANEHIRSCITGAIIAFQIKNEITSELSSKLDSISVLSNSADSVVIENNVKNIIIADKGYKKIETYLLEDCQALKSLIIHDNHEFDNSVSNKKKAITYYNEGVVYFRNQDYANALPKFEAAVKADKNFAFAWDNLGLCQRNTGEYKMAIKSYEKSLGLDPKGRVPLMNIAVAYESLKDYDNAIVAYKRFSRVFPDDPEVYYGISRMYHATKDYENALNSIFQAYLIYKETQSPYIQDAEKNVSVLYKEMKAIGQIDLFNTVAKKYNIKID